MTVPDIDALLVAHEKINTKTDPALPGGLKPLSDGARDRLQANLRDAEDTIVISADEGMNDSASPS